MTATKYNNSYLTVSAVESNICSYFMLMSIFTGFQIQISGM